jgi:hypothetical protein
MNEKRRRRRGRQQNNALKKPWKLTSSSSSFRGRRKNPLDTNLGSDLFTRCRSKFSHSYSSRIDLLTALAVTFTLTCPRHSLGHVFFFPCCVLYIFIYLESGYPSTLFFRRRRHTHIHTEEKRDRGGKNQTAVLFPCHLPTEMEVE